MKFLPVFIPFYLLYTPAASFSSDVQDTINVKVWRPFVMAYNHSDYEVYSDDVLRITGRDVVVGEDCFTRIKKSFGSRKEDEQVELKLYFDQRLHDETKAYETGFYQVCFTKAEKSTSTYADRFHVVLEKQDGTWKIIEDYDTGNILGQPVDETAFTHLPVVEE